jgi:sulfite exporter TauE/SafE
VSYISTTQSGPRQGLKIYFIFSLTRLVIYALFGVLVGFLGQWVLDKFFASPWVKGIFLGFGIFLIVLGLLLLAQKLPAKQCCPPWVTRQLGRGTRHAVIFSLIVALSPCLPLWGVLGYIALISDTWSKGLFYMLAFGLGTVVSPMILFCAAAGWLAKFSRRFEFWFFILRFLCCGVFIFLGINLLRYL